MLERWCMCLRQLPDCLISWFMFCYFMVFLCIYISGINLMCLIIWRLKFWGLIQEKLMFQLWGVMLVLRFYLFYLRFRTYFLILIPECHILAFINAFYIICFYIHFKYIFSSFTGEASMFFHLRRNYLSHISYSKWWNWSCWGKKNFLFS